MAHATLKFIIEKNLPQNASRVGHYLAAKLEGLKSRFGFIVAVRGRGLLQAMEFNKDIADSLTMACLEKGLLVNRVKPNALRFMPPLIIGEEEIDQAVAILEEVLAGQRGGSRV